LFFPVVGGIDAPGGKIAYLVHVENVHHARRQKVAVRVAENVAAVVKGPCIQLSQKIRPLVTIENS